MKSSEVRRQKSNEYIKSQGIACFEQLPLRIDTSQASIRAKKDICERALASLLVIQVACSILQKEDYQDAKEFISKLLLKYGVDKALTPKEMKLLDGSYTNQDAIDVAWTYESYWALVWALKLTDNMDPSSICDCDAAIGFVQKSGGYEDFYEKCELRDIEEILDMLDLYYRYHWACVENNLRPETPIGNLESEVVMERRRGLEWLFDQEENWEDVSLHT